MRCSSAVGGWVTRPQIVGTPDPARFWPFPIPNDSGIQGAIGIHGRRAQESVVNETRLRRRHDIVHRGGRHHALKGLLEKPAVVSLVAGIKRIDQLEVLLNAIE